WADQRHRGVLDRAQSRPESARRGERGLLRWGKRSRGRLRLHRGQSAAWRRQHHERQLRVWLPNQGRNGGDRRQDRRRARQAVVLISDMSHSAGKLVLINNAGLASGLAKIHEGDPEDWDRMIDTNLKGLLYVSRAIMPHMVARRRGHVVNIGSTAGHQTYPMGNVYNATKFGVRALTE